jgi:hypothetical protein
MLQANHASERGLHSRVLISYLCCSPVAAHNRRQYMFKLNSTFTVDGGPLGNESRYINHASGDKANVQAHGMRTISLYLSYIL